MSEHKIIWTEKTVNIFTGCTKCSPGCLNCYAERMAKRLQKIPSTAEKYRNGFTFTHHPRDLTNFYYDLRVTKKPKKIFVNSMSDTFHESADCAVVETLFEMMNELNWHTFQLLTKRPQNIPEGMNWSDNIQLGVTICNQEEANKKIPLLLKVTARKKFLSIEPMLGPIDISICFIKNACGCTEFGNDPIGDDAYRCKYCKDTGNLSLVDLVIVGGESGPGARPMHPDWARSIRDQCKDTGVPFLFKQWGAYGPANGDNMVKMDKPGRTLDGVIHNGNDS